MSARLITRLMLPLIVSLALLASVITGTASAASSLRAAGAAPDVITIGGKVSPVPPPPLAPCTKPLLGPIRDCESTSPTVARWFSATAAGSACTFQFTIDWGDGTPDWSGIVTDPAPGLHLLAEHNYDASTKKSYTETVYNAVVAGSCTAPPTTVFGFTHLRPNNQPWWAAFGAMPKACREDLIPNPVAVGLDLVELGQILGVFAITGGWGVVFEVAEIGAFGYEVYDVLFKLAKDCVNKDYSLGSLPRAFDYGADRLGKLFKPAGGVAKIPQITSIGAYQNGVLDYFRLTYSDPGHDAKGFGFVGINGSGWAEENHPFTAPSYGIVGPDTIDYPFNLLCGTAEQYSSYVEAWIYNSQGIRSYPVEVALTCT